MDLLEATLRAKQGDRAAFETLVRFSIDRQSALARVVLRDPDLACDAVQNALLLAWRDLPGLRDPACFEAWMFRLTLHAAIEEARKRHRHNPEVEFPPGFVVTDSDPAQGIVDRDALEEALADLDADHRALVALHVCVGLPLAEVAESLGIPVGTAKSRVHRALAQMRASMEADETQRSPAAGRPGFGVEAED